MKDDEKVLLIVSPNMAIEMLGKDRNLSDIMLVCMFAPDDVALVVKGSDWNAMIDNGEVFERVESDVIATWNQRMEEIE